MNAADERARAVHERAKEWKLDRAVVAEMFPLRWKSNSVPVQVVFFILTAIGLGAVYGFGALFDAGGALTFLVGIGTAESLIRLKRWMGTGVEAALSIGGLLSAISMLPSTGSKEVWLMIAVALAIAGRRVRVPLFGAGAAIVVAVWFEERFDLGVLAALLMASVAAIALLRTWERPSTEWLFILMAVGLPLAGIPMIDARWETVTMLLYGAFGVIAFVLAIVRRHHALFFSGAVGITVLIIDFVDDLEVPVELALFVAGASLLLLSWIVARVLRGRTTGFVVTPAKLTGADEAIQIAGAIALAPREAHAETPAPVSGGGEFGGAGASGQV